MLMLLCEFQIIVSGSLLSVGQVVVPWYTSCSLTYSLTNTDRTQHSNWNRTCQEIPLVGHNQQPAFNDKFCDFNQLQTKSGVMVFESGMSTTKEMPYIETENTPIMALNEGLLMPSPLPMATSPWATMTKPCKTTVTKLFQDDIPSSDLLNACKPSYSISQPKPVNQAEPGMWPIFRTNLHSDIHAAQMEWPKQIMGSVHPHIEVADYQEQVKHLFACHPVSPSPALLISKLNPFQFNWIIARSGNLKRPVQNQQQKSHTTAKHFPTLKQQIKQQFTPLPTKWGYELRNWRVEKDDHSNSNSNGQLYGGSGKSGGRESRFYPSNI